MDQLIHAGRISLMDSQRDVHRIEHSRVWNMIILWHLTLRIS